MKKKTPLAYQEWLKIVLKKMNHLSKPQAVVLGMWSFAIAMTHCCGLSTVTVFLAEMLEQSENTVRERLRQWYYDGGEKKAVGNLTGLNCCLTSKMLCYRVGVS